MYLPAHFQESRLEAQLALIAANPLAAIVWQSPDGMVADHIPLFFQADSVGKGRLIGHVAKNNPLWQFAADTEVLVIFQGANAYISPNWYATKSETGKAVPTWNYSVVHVYGRIRAITDPTWIRQQLSTLTALHEQSQAQPWHMAEAPTDYMERMLNAVVGIEIEVSQMLGKAKMSQNQVPPNQHSVAAALQDVGSEMANEVAAQMLANQGCGV